jgi:hypothetical protein
MMCPVRGTHPAVGLRSAIPQKWAGNRMPAPVSLPMSSVRNLEGRLALCLHGGVIEKVAGLSVAEGVHHLASVYEVAAVPRSSKCHFLAKGETARARAEMSAGR